MERVELVDRPGSFFVINHTLGRVRLLASDETEFTVEAEQVKRPVVMKKKAAAKSSNTSKPTTDFSQYTEFIGHLLVHREQVHIYFRGRLCVKPVICDRYLELTGEELDPRDIWTEPDETLGGKPRTWKVPWCHLMFPEPGQELLLPSKVFHHNNYGNNCYISNTAFAWFLIEHHGFRINIKHHQEAFDAGRQAGERTEVGDVRAAEGDAG